MQQFKTTAFSRSEYCHRDRGRSRFRLTVFHRTRRPPLVTGIRLFYLSVSRVRQKNELGAVGNEKPSFDDLVPKFIEEYSVQTKQGKTIALCWIPSHVGIPENEKADSDAKGGLSFSLSLH